MISRVFTLRNTAERNATLLALFVAMLGGLGLWAEGSIYSATEAIDMINALSSSALYLGTAIAGSSGTILALMLTLLGIVKRMDNDLDIDVYRRINLVGILSAISLIGAVLLLLLLCLPIGEYDKIPNLWYTTLYRILFLLVIALSAVLVATIAILYGTVRALIVNITPSDTVE